MSLLIQRQGYGKESVPKEVKRAPNFSGLTGKSGLIQPDMLPNLVAWYRFNQGITVTGQGVSQWDDASGNANHFLQTTDANRPLPGSLGSELVTNGGFDSDITGWQNLTALPYTTLEWSSGTIHAADASGTNAFHSDDNISVESGKSYLGTATSVLNSGQTPGLSLNANGGGTSRYTLASSGHSAGVKKGIFTATVTEDVVFQATTTAAADYTVDNVSVKEIDFTQGVLFDGIAHYLSATIAGLVQPTTVYLLGKQITWTSTDRIFDGATDNSGGFLQDGSSPRVYLKAPTEAFFNSDFILDTYSVVSVVFNSTSSLIQINNGTPATGDAGTNNMGGLTLGSLGTGGGKYSNIQVKEVCIFDTEAHNSATITKIANYLNHIGGGVF